MRDLIVGIDGTAASLRALSWAAETVGRHGRLHAVVAVNAWTEHFVDLLTGESIGHLPTTGVATLETADAPWEAAREGMFRLVDFDYPKKA